MLPYDLAQATYPAQKTNLGLYNPWLVNWYCDNTMQCNFPEHGRKCGYAVTCIWGPPRDGYDRVSWIDVLKALEVNRAAGRPSALIIKQDFPEEYANKVGLVGGNMANAMKVLGVVGCISDGPIRDLDEVSCLVSFSNLRSIAVLYGLAGWLPNVRWSRRSCVSLACTSTPWGPPLGTASSAFTPSTRPSMSAAWTLRQASSCTWTKTAFASSRLTNSRRWSKTAKSSKERRTSHSRT